MRLFWWHHDRLINDGNAERDRGGSPGVIVIIIIIIIAARRVGDGPLLKAVRAASIQKNCLHGHSLRLVYGKNNMGICAKATLRRDHEQHASPHHQSCPDEAASLLFSPMNSMKSAEHYKRRQAQHDQDGNDKWRNEPAIDHMQLPRDFFADPISWRRPAETASGFVQRTSLARFRRASARCTPAGKPTEPFADGRHASLRSTLKVDQVRDETLRVLGARTRRSNQEILLAALDAYLQLAQDD